MNRVVKIGFPILCVCVIGGTFGLLKKFQKDVNEYIENSNEVNRVSENSTDVASESDSESEDNSTIRTDTGELDDGDEVVYSIPIE